MWLFLGVACMVVVLALLRNVDRLANYKYTLMIAGFVAAAVAACCPSSARR